MGPESRPDGAETWIVPAGGGRSASVAAPEAPATIDIAPPGRSVVARFEWRERRLAWGATTAVAAGVLAAWPAPWDVGDGVRAVAVWFAVVPLAGAVWAPVLRRGSDARVVAPRTDGRRRVRDPRGDGGGAGSRVARLGAGAARAVASRADASISLLLALVITALLGAPAAWTLAGGFALFGLAWWLAGHPPSAHGAVRSALELALPGLVAWLALDGAVAVPPPLAAGSHGLASIGHWWRLNGLFPAILIGFAVVHGAATGARGPRDLPGRRRWLGAAYVGIVAALAAADRPWGAGAVALLFVLQWPFQAAFQAGRVRWHYRAIEALAALAMLAAALAAGRGGA